MEAASREAIGRVAGLLRPDSRVLFVTGAGISADSGLPTYRGIGGMYSDGRTTRHGYTIEEALSGRVMNSEPEVTWEFLHELEHHSRGARPNPGHEAIARFDRLLGSVCVFTQNVDGFHKQAGSRHVIDIHGDLHELKCTECNYRTRVDDYAEVAPLPRCPRCAAVVRPDVVLFGEMLPLEKLADLRRQQEQGFDVVFTVGTTSRFPYISEPILRARSEGVTTVEIDPGPTDISRLIDIKIPERAADALGLLLESYLARHPTGD